MIPVLLEALGERIGLPNLALDASGSLHLRIGDLGVDLTGASDDRLLLSCLAAELPAGREAEAALSLLGANALFQATDGSTLGVPAGSTAVVLSREIRADRTDAAELERILERFVSTALGVPALLTAPASPADDGRFLNMTRV